MGVLRNPWGCNSNSEGIFVAVLKKFLGSLACSRSLQRLAAWGAWSLRVQGGRVTENFGMLLLLLGGWVVWWGAGLLGAWVRPLLGWCAPNLVETWQEVLGCW